jgi:hypothetical protein
MKLPRFSLRTLFMLITVIGLVLGWIVYQKNWQHQRHNFLVEHNCGILIMDRAKAPWSLSVLGEPAADYLIDVPDDCKDLARALYPEAIAINPNPADLPKDDPELRIRIPLPPRIVAQPTPGSGL